jgi:hypothetical protein
VLITTADARLPSVAALSLSPNSSRRARQRIGIAMRE